MKRIFSIISEEIQNELDMSPDSIEKRVVEYIKGFGQKGKLTPFEGSLKPYYAQYMEQAYQWASEKLDDVRRNGFAYFKHLFDVYVIGKVSRNKRGLIYVERNIDIDPKQDLSQLEYSSVGECWSWKRGNGSSYCADFSLLNEDVRTVTICGYVHPDSVDWLETVYLNSYDMKNETEIRMNDNATVEVGYIKIHGKKISLGGSYLIKANSDKYRKKDW